MPRNAERMGRKEKVSARNQPSLVLRDEAGGVL